MCKGDNFLPGPLKFALDIKVTGRAKNDFANILVTQCRVEINVRDKSRHKNPGNKRPDNTGPPPSTCEAWLAWRDGERPVCEQFEPIRGLYVNSLSQSEARNIGV